MAMLCFCSLWLVVAPQPRGSQMHPAGLAGGFCPPSCRYLFFKQVLPACPPCTEQRAELVFMM